MAGNIKDELVVSNETSNLASVRDFILDNLRKTELPQSDHVKIVLAVDEAVSNIIRHAYEDFTRGTRTIEILFWADETKVTFVLKDSGREFDPTIVGEPDIHEHIKLGKRYGLGLFLMRRIMDEVKFIFRSGIENMLTMVKYIHPPQTQTGSCEPRQIDTDR